MTFVRLSENTEYGTPYKSLQHAQEQSIMEFRSILKQFFTQETPMKQLKVIWDPIGGLAVPEGIVTKEVDSLIEVINGRTQSYEYRVGCYALVNEIRVRINRGEIDYLKVIFVIGEDEIHPHANGRLPRWPRGFCDLIDGQLCELIG